MNVANLVVAGAIALIVGLASIMMLRAPAPKVVPQDDPSPAPRRPQAAPLFPKAPIWAVCLGWAVAVVVYGFVLALFIKAEVAGKMLVPLAIMATVDIRRAIRTRRN